MILVEMRKLARRPRTWVTLLLLDGLPVLVAVLVKITKIGPRPGQGPTFLSAVLNDGSLFPAAALAIVLPLFLPISVSVISGDAVAGEAQAGTLRYLLIRPVSRTKLLVAKLISVWAFVVASVLLVAGTGFIVGRTMFSVPQGGTVVVITTVSGTPLTTGQIAIRTFLAIGYVTLSMLGVAAMGLFLSTITDSPLTAALGAMALLISSSVLLTLDAARSLQPYLPTRYWLAFTDMFRDPILWRNIERGVLLQAVYVVVLLGAAWANFATKDVTS